MPSPPGGRKAAVVTDLGRVTAAVEAGIRGAHLLLAEANYEPEWLESGPYPPFLKARIRGERGHLSKRGGGRAGLRRGGPGGGYRGAGPPLPGEQHFPGGPTTRSGPPWSGRGRPWAGM